MAEKLYFIKTNPVAAKINLYNKICREEEGALQVFKENQKTNFELIKKKVQENAESLNKEEVEDIFNWFASKYISDPEEMKTQLFVHGFDIFYEINNAEKVENFNALISDYEKYSTQYLGYKCNTEDFNRFLIYGIFFTGFINKKKEDYLSDYLQINHKDLFSFAEQKFNAGNTELYRENNFPDFKELYDCTKFYKGLIFRL
ncbi:hypothetical protein [Chryseobacterium sp.]|uniref:hypothetical protein n=1 Tax=Chryseobacterium sp. TaxID=1871047 RepID=UPI0035C71B1C